MRKLLRVCLVSALALCAAPTLVADEPFRTSGFHIIDFITAGDGALDSPEDLVYDADPCDPEQPEVLGQVLKPNGQPLTFGEYSKASGRATLRCTKNKGTQVEIKASGLIPKGVYTVWVLVGPFDAAGMPAGEGSLGAVDGTQNKVTASGAGEASLTVFQPGGPLSEFGSVSDCLLNDEVLLVMVYHPDGQTFGPTPGPTDAPNMFCYFIEHLAFYSSPAE